MNFSAKSSYQNFLEANATETADTQIDLFEEGDYEIALDYEIRKTNVDIFGWDPFPTYTNYRISFQLEMETAWSFPLMSPQEPN